MDLDQNDFVAGSSISMGHYLGRCQVPFADKTITLHKVYEPSQNLYHYLPDEETKKLRKLPSANEYETYLKKLKVIRPIDEEKYGESRYQYLSNKYKEGKLQEVLEVYFELDQISQSSKLNLSEKKLKNQIAEKLVTEIAFVFKISDEEAQAKIQLQ